MDPFRKRNLISSDAVSFQLSCLFVLALAAIVCEGNGRNFLRNPNYRDLYYRNQFYGGLSAPNPVPIRTQTADRVTQKVEEDNDDNVDEIDDTEDGILADEKGLSEVVSTISGSGKGLYDPNVLRPLIICKCYSFIYKLFDVHRKY